MADTQEAIRRLTIQTSAPGADQAAASLRGVQGALDGVTVASTNTDKATLSLDSKFASIERRYNTALRNQQDYAKLQTQVNLAVAQNPALQDRANAVLASAADRYGQVTGAQKAFGIASQTVNLQVAALASGLGLSGQVLSAFGPQGFAAAVALGAVQAALSLASDKAHELAQKAKELTEFSEATGLTTTQFQALRSEAGKFGIDSETLASGLTKFTAGFENLRLGQGDLLTQIRRINPAIADQMQQTTDAATAFTLFGKAVEQTDNIFQRNALLKAGMGKGASAYGAFFESTPDVAALAASFSAAGKGIDANLIPKLKQLQIDIDKTKSAANTVFASMFGTSTLETELEFQRGLLAIATTLKTFSFSDDFKKLISFLTDPRTLLALGALTLGAAALSGGTLLAVGGAVVAGAGAYGAATNAIREQGKLPATNAALPPAPNFNSTFDAVTKSGAATQTAIDARTEQAITADMEKRVGLLGSAATATEKYDLAVRKLSMGQDGLKLSGDDLARATAALGLDKATALVSAHNSAMGASLPVQDAVNAKTLELQRLQVQGAGLTPKQIADQQSLAREQALGTAQIKAQIDATNVQAATIGMSAGASAAYTAKQTLLNDAIRNHKTLTDADVAAIDQQAKALGAAVQAAAQHSAESKASFDLQTSGLSDVDRQIAQVQYQLHGDGWQNFINDGLAATMRLTDQLKTMTDYANTFGQSLTQALASGKSGTDALNAGVGALGSKMSSDLMSKGTSQAMSGAMSGSADTMSSGGGNIVAALVISYLQGEAAKAKQAKADYEAAQTAWANMAGEVTKFKDQMLGTNTGSLGAAISDATDKAQSYADAAHKAGQATGDLTSVLATYVQRMTRDFMNTFDATIEALNEGLGMDSPAVKAAANVKSIGDTLKGFIDDTMKAGQGLASAGPAISAATASSQAYALSLLQTPPVLTTVQTALLTLRGNAQQLQTTLQDLGMSAGDAGAAISTGIKAALAGISATFAQGLQEQINSASGKDYISQINALLTQGASNLSDAQSLGMDPTLVAQAFQTQAQAVIDSAGLVGSAFDDFITQFPELSGVVNQSTTAIKSLSDATTQFYANLKTTISTYLHNLNTGAQSALSPQDRLATAQTDYNTQLALAQGGNRDAIGSITQYSNDLLSAAKDYFASSAGYADILKQVQTQLATLPTDAASNDPVVEQLKQVTTNTGNTVDTLAALQSIQAATQSSSVNISASVTQLGAQSAYVAAAQGSQYFGPMNAYLSQIVTNTALSGQAASKPDSGSVWWNPFTWFAEGGSVTGGTPGKDSVMAMLTPNEFVVKPGPATDYLPLLQAMNAGMLPPLQHFANGGMVMPVSVQMPMISAAYGMSSGSAAGNDNGQHFSDLGNTLVRAITGAAMAEITSNKEEMAMLRAEIVALRRAVEGGKPKAAQAGTRMAS